MFYIHLLKNADVLEKMMVELGEVYGGLRPNEQALANPVVGMFCAAKYQGTVNTYRGLESRQPGKREQTSRRFQLRPFVRN